MKNSTKIRIGVAIAAAVLVLIFIFLNTQEIEVNLIFAKVTMRRSIMLIGIFAMGFLAGWMFKSIMAMKKKP